MYTEIAYTSSEIIHSIYIHYLKVYTKWLVKKLDLKKKGVFCRYYSTHAGHTQSHVTKLSLTLHIINIHLSFFLSLSDCLTLHMGQREDCISMLHGTEDLDAIWFRRGLRSISAWPVHCLGSSCGCQFRALTWITVLNQWCSGILPKASKRAKET